MFFKIAVLNMVKHKKRTMLILLAIAVSVAIMEFVAGMLQGMQHNFYHTIVTQSGHVQFHAQGWEDRLNPVSLDYPLASAEEILAVLATQADFLHAERILRFGALLILDDKNVAIQGLGVEYNSRFFHNAKSAIVRGRSLEHETDLLISTRVAKLLGVDTEDYVTVLVEDSESSPYYLDFQVCGLFESDSRLFDDMHFLISHRSAEELVYLPSQTIEIRVELKDRDASTNFVQQSMANLEAYSLEAKTWQEINGSMLVLFELFDVFIWFINILVVFVAAVVITNAILMNVFERVQEFGTIRAIGLKKHELFRMILTEGAVQGVLGSVLGLLVGIPLVLYLQKNGIDWGEWTEALGFGGSIEFLFLWRSSVLNFFFGVVIAVSGSLYAAFVAAKMNIMDSLNHN